MNIKDYAHYYIGQPCFNTWFPADHEAYNAGWKLTGIQSTSVRPFGLENETDKTWTESIMLVLRRLEDITEEEMIELFQSMVPDGMEDKPSNDEFTVNVFRCDGGNLVDENVAIGAEYSCRCFEGQLTIKKCGTICAYDEAGDEEELVNAPRAYHYLLTRGFDLFGLIDAGLAIDTKTLTP